MALLGSYIKGGSPGRFTNAALQAVLRLKPAKRWSNKIGQNSVLEARRFGRRSGLFWEKLYGHAGLMRSMGVSPAVKDVVLRSLKSSYGGLDKGSRTAEQKVGLSGKVALDWTWPANGTVESLSSTTEHILACHIGTRLFEMKYSHAACPTSAADEKTAACHLSYYNAYLVAAAPGLLPDSPAWTEKRYKEVVEDVQAALGKEDDGASDPMAQRYERLLKELNTSYRDKVLQRVAEWRRTWGTRWRRGGSWRTSGRRWCCSSRRRRTSRATWRPWVVAGSSSGSCGRFSCTPASRIGTRYLTLEASHEVGNQSCDLVPLPSIFLKFRSLLGNLLVRCNG